VKCLNKELHKADYFGIWLQSKTNLSQRVSKKQDSYIPLHPLPIILICKS